MQLQFMSSEISFNQKLYIFWLNFIAISPSFTFRLQQSPPTELPVCDKKPLNNIFIAANGAVSPCVFLNPPIQGDLKWYKDGHSYPQFSSIFGDLQVNSLKRILQGQQFKNFCEKYKSRKDFYENALSKVSYSMSGVDQLELAKKQISKMFNNYPVPTPCKYCHKTDGF